MKSETIRKSRTNPSYRNVLLHKSLPKGTEKRYWKEQMYPILVAFIGKDIYFSTADLCFCKDNSCFSYRLGQNSVQVQKIRASKSTDK